MKTPRIVRVESNLKQKEDATLHSQLLKHRGNIAGPYMGGGDHRQSLLRKYIGSALMNKYNKYCNTWEEPKANTVIRKLEHWLEMEISKHIQKMQVLVIPIESGNEEIKKLALYIEENIIALLSNFYKYPIDSPSPEWLGRYCQNNLVQISGLWNTHGVMKRYDRGFLQWFEKIIIHSVNIS